MIEKLDTPVVTKPNQFGESATLTHRAYRMTADFTQGTPQVDVQSVLGVLDAAGAFHAYQQVSGGIGLPPGMMGIVEDPNPITSSVQVTGDALVALLSADAKGKKANVFRTDDAQAAAKAVVADQKAKVQAAKDAETKRQADDLAARQADLDKQKAAIDAQKAALSSGVKMVQ